jgi:hypothetical protein
MLYREVIDVSSEIYEYKPKNALCGQTVECLNMKYSCSSVTARTLKAII